MNYLKNGSNDLIQIENRYIVNSLSKKGDMLLQIDLRLVPIDQSAAAVRTEPLRSDPVHG